MAHFTERLKEARKLRRWSQNKLSRMAGETRLAVWEYETGKREPSRSSIEAICKAMRVPADWLLGLSDDMDDREIDGEHLVRMHLVRKRISEVNARSREAYRVYVEARDGCAKALRDLQKSCPHYNHHLNAGMGDIPWCSDCGAHLVLRKTKGPPGRGAPKAGEEEG